MTGFKYLARRHVDNAYDSMLLSAMNICYTGVLLCILAIILFRNGGTQNE